MRDYYGEDQTFEVMPVGTGFWGARTVAFIIDSIFIAFPLLLFVYVLGGLGMLLNPLGNWLYVLIFMLIFGFLQVIYFTFLEGTGEKSYSIGKALMNLEVISLDGGPVTGGQAFKRNASKLLKILLLIDIIAGSSSARREDYSQKSSDISARTAIQVLVFAPTTPKRKPFKKVSLADKPKRRVKKRDLGFPAHLLNGQCPRCQSPYKIIPPDDKTTWSGLWNYRCTWCNKLVFDTGPGRVKPGDWGPASRSYKEPPGWSYPGRPRVAPGDWR
ncbi:MAG: RDD family protein [Thermoplasmata archaeon]|nr:MAG: RDD family protein [Thermoplasmata archaeon]